MHLIKLFLDFSQKVSLIKRSISKRKAFSENINCLHLNSEWSNGKQWFVLQNLSKFFFCEVIQNIRKEGPLDE